VITLLGVCLRVGRLQNVVDMSVSFSVIQKLNMHKYQRVNDEAAGMSVMRGIAYEKQE